MLFNLILTSVLSMFLCSNFLFAGDEGDKPSRETQKVIDAAVRAALEGEYGELVGVSFDASCLEHKAGLKTIYCSVAYSTGDGTLGMMAVKVKADGKDLKILEHIKA